jgi:hypothetical protein
MKFNIGHETTSNTLKKVKFLVKLQRVWLAQLPLLWYYNIRSEDMQTFCQISKGNPSEPVINWPTMKMRQIAIFTTGRRAKKASETVHSKSFVMGVLP